jgi:hypothetical protein
LLIYGSMTTAGLYTTNLFLPPTKERERSSLCYPWYGPALAWWKISYSPQGVTMQEQLKIRIFCNTWSLLAVIFKMLSGETRLLLEWKTFFLSIYFPQGYTTFTWLYYFTILLLKYIPPHPKNLDSFTALLNNIPVFHVAAKFHVRKTFFIFERNHSSAIFLWMNSIGLKGTVSRDFLCPVFFIKHLLLVPIGMPRTDFKFFRIFVELFIFVIDSPAMNTPGSRLTLILTSEPIYGSHNFKAQ